MLVNLIGGEPAQRHRHHLVMHDFAEYAGILLRRILVHLRKLTRRDGLRIQVRVLLRPVGRWFLEPLDELLGNLRPLIR